ncbi:MAG TPA: tripartite tricarboxylate transporter substrate binding protein [Burkholderiales bacterium]|nr:tripartite tricarboxylate transporter substrate binding protein [Burkholderiales bacterium]
MASSIVRMNLAAATALLLSVTALSADFPAKPVRIITPFPPGGSVDLVARLLAADLAKAWGQQVLVDNRAGASGNIGTELAKNAAPDGYALLLNTLPFVTNQFVYSTMPFDPLTDFAPISIVSSVDALLVVHPSLPVQNVRELIALAKARPGALSYGTAGAATNPHIAAELLNYMGKINLFAVHYKGGGAATTAAMSGETPIFFSNTVADALPLVETRRLRALGVTSLKRSPFAPQIPTLAESGLPGYEFTTWHVFAAPAATPRALINQIADKVRASLKTPDAVQRWRDRSVEIIANTPEEAAAHLKKEVQKWRVVFKERGMKAE